jgi:nucleoside-diphosphate-sugar epimerase
LTRILVFGASGSVGRFFLSAMVERDENIIAVSRVSPGPSSNRLTWLQRDLCGVCDDLPTADIIVSLGPLDAFVAWFERYRPNGCRRVIALSSMSAISKRDSPDAAERALAATLESAESRLITSARSRGIEWTIFRPTLIYGAGTDRSLAPIAQFALRRRILPIPFGQTGLRQPIHADDLARACIAAIDRENTFGVVYPLGGGERLRFDAMLNRIRRALPKRSIAIPIPIALLSVLTPLAPYLGFAKIGIGALRRLREDLVADNARAAADFGFAPRDFRAEDVLVR